jgi:hypothetical protein
MRPQACRSLRLDGDLVTDVLDVAVQQVSHLLNGRTERETVSQFREVDRWPGPFWLKNSRWIGRPNEQPSDKAL